MFTILSPKRSFNVRYIVFVITLLILPVLGAAASNTAVSWLRSVTGLIGIESFATTAGRSRSKSENPSSAAAEIADKAQNSPAVQANPLLVDTVIAGWDFFGQNSPNTFAATTFDSHLVDTGGARNITRGAGAAPSTGGNSFRTTGFQNNGISTSGNDYFQITLSATSGNKLSLSAIDAKYNGTASFFASPGVTSQYAYSLNGTTFILIGSPMTTTSLSPPPIDLTGISALQNVPSGTTVTLRYYASGQTTTGGWGYSSSAAGINGLAVIGSTAPATVPPTGLTYAQNPAVYTKGVAIAANSPSSGGGAVESYSISPSLPTGLNFNTATGVIGGTPAVVSSSTDYTVTASNAGGSTMATVNITVNNPVYVISASAGANGSISPSGDVSIPEGANQTFSITPAPGYNIADVLVDNTSVGAVSSYEFTNVTATHTIEAIFSNCEGISTPTLTSPSSALQSIPVNTTDLTGAGVIAAQFTLTYDPSVLSSLPADISVTPGAVLPTGANAPQIDYNANTPGTIYISVFGSTPFTGAGSIVNINMRVTGAVSTVTPLSVSDFLYNGGLICTIVSNGSLTVVATPTATGISSSSNPSVYGTPVTFTATVSPIPAGGTVAFVIDGTTVAAAVALDGSGQAAYTTSSLTGAGSPHAVTAIYSGFGIQFEPSSGSLSGGQIITKANQTISVTQAAPLTAIYGTSFTVAATASSGLSVAITASGACSQSGAATITMTSGTGDCVVYYNQPGDGNYNAANEVTSTTAAQKADATWTTAPATKVYGDTDPAPLTTGSGTGFITADNVTATYSRAAGEPIGIYHVTAVLSATGNLNNYNITNAGADFTITKRPAVWATASASKIYGDADPAPLTTGSGSQFLPADGVTAVYFREPGESAAGSPYHITAVLSATGDLNNYLITNQGADFTITRRDATWTTNSANKVYGNSDPTPLTTGTGSGFLAADNVIASYTREPGESVAGGPYQIIAALTAGGDLNNYNISNAGASFTITKRPATWTTVPAEKLFDTADPIPLTTGSGSNFLAADGVTASYSRAAGEAVGIYPMTALLSATGDLNNYLVTNAGANFAINGRFLTGNVTYKNAAVPIVPVANTTITAAGGTPLPAPVVNLLDGTYSMTGFGAPAYTVSASKTDQSCLSPRGIFADDASLIARHVVRLITLNETQIEAGKVSGLSQLTSFDAALIAQYIVCIANPINRSGQWKFTPASVTVGAATVQNFEGILKGDVNGSWTADTTLAGMNPPSADPQKAVRAALPVVTAAQGRLISLPLRFENLGGGTVDSYQFDIEYDPSVIEPAQPAVSLAGTNAEGLSVVSNSPRPGVLKVVVYGTRTVAGDGVYANLKFNLIGSAGAVTNLDLRAFRLNDGQAEVDLNDGRLTVAAAADSILRGRLLSQTGETIGRARLVLTSTTGERLTAVSNSFGNFEFTGLTFGETYTISVAAREQRFTPRTVSIAGSVTELVMIAEQ